MKIKFLWALGLLTLLSQLAAANELVLSRAELARRGYRPAPTTSGPVWRGESLAAPEPAPPFEAHSLPWPVPFEDARHTIGNVMTQFQNYDTTSAAAYYHGGDDLRVHSREWVSAPISGRLEAGHYAYDTLADGSMKKYWKPWPEEGDAMYFEVAVINPQGYRFEMHHIDRDTLTEPVLAALKAGHGSVQAGEKLGQVVEWPNSDTDETTYNHTHYNIISPEGVNLNPEHYSRELGDHVAPQITAIYAVSGSDARPLGDDGRLAQAPDELVVAAFDKLGDNIYKHTPSYARLVFENGTETTWDFRERLRTADGRFPPIWEFFKDALTLATGETLTTTGNYDSRNFLLRLKVPAGAHGKFRVEIGDSAGNIAVRTGEM